MARIIILILYLLIGVQFAVLPQSKVALMHEKLVGDQLPDIIFNHVYNNSKKKIKLYDFQSSLIILDFWSTSCSSCIALFPHMQSLQEKFKDELQIILVNGKTQVTNDNEEKTKRLLERIKQKKGVEIKLPIVFNSTELDNFFPWQSIPHEVWIKDGTVIGITGADEVTEKNISAILHGQKIRLRTKRDLLYDFSKTTLAEIVYEGKPVNVQSVYSSTLIKGFLDGINGHNGRVRSETDSKKYIRWFSSNESLVNLYRNAYYPKVKFPIDNKVIVEISSADLLWKANNRSDSGYYDNVFSYDINAPATSIDTLLSFAQNDLERIFHTKVFSAKRKVKCYVISADKSSFSSFTKNNEKEWQTEGSKKYIKNYSAREIISNLDIYSSIPLIDETILDKNVDMELPENLRDEKALIEAFRKAGFIVKEEERELDVVVITDK